MKARCNNPEAELSGPVSDWLIARGYEVYAEVPWAGKCIDLLGVKEAHRVTVELKVALTWVVIRQAAVNQVVSHRAFVAVATQPRAASLAKCAKVGVGVLTVRGGYARMILPARLMGYLNPRWYDGLLDQCEPGGTSGLANQSGQGPAQRCARLVDRYRKAHPGASWQEVFDRVSNHYAHARLMRGALSSLLARGR